MATLSNGSNQTPDRFVPVVEPGITAETHLGVGVASQSLFQLMLLLFIQPPSHVTVVAVQVSVELPSPESSPPC